jgi:dynein heavy chain 1
MEFTKIRCLESLFALVRRGITNILEYNEYHQEFPMTESQITSYMQKWVVFCAMWGIGGSMNLQTRTEFSEELKSFCSVDLPVCQENESLLDFEIDVQD